MTTLSQFMGGGIKSVQRGVFAGTTSTAEATINISPVNPAKAFVNMNSTLSPPSGSYRGKIRLSSSTTLAVVSVVITSTEVAEPLNWEVIEFY